jgi:hypothetical protein
VGFEDIEHETNPVCSVVFLDFFGDFSLFVDCCGFRERTIEYYSGAIWVSLVPRLVLRNNIPALEDVERKALERIHQILSCTI